MADMIGMIDSMNGPSSDDSGDGVGSMDSMDGGTPDVGDMADEVRGMADEVASINDESAGGFGSTDTEPNQKYKSNDAGDSQVTIGKTKSEPYTGLANNNTKTTESVDPVVQSISAHLLKAYAEFKNQ
jgi:hypothetical protein